VKEAGHQAPQEFAKALLVGEEWRESAGTSARFLLSTLLQAPVEQLKGEEWRVEARRAFAILASTSAHANADQLKAYYGERGGGEVRASAPAEAQLDLPGPQRAAGGR